jgi:hypothetical protein
MKGNGDGFSAPEHEGGITKITHGYRLKGKQGLAGVCSGKRF